MRGDSKIYHQLEAIQIPYEYYEHEAIPTIEMALIHKAHIDATHCKNIFLRNHKGNKHYFVVIEQSAQVDIHFLEQQLKQGKLSFASEQRLMKHLGVLPGAVSPLGLIYDIQKNTTVFIDSTLKEASRLSFHPNTSDASLVISTSDLLKYIDVLNIQREWLSLQE
ncbi:MAG: prolyl-tRNA synthetase associated domain-containing protein [Bacteroidales bacterium]|nr:prolyl-tRNA synthetase associated domain-containing protein [Bacteroidales bacterium]